MTDGSDRIYKTNMNPCQVCGNDIAAGSSTCRYCGSRQSGSFSGLQPKGNFQHRVVNLEQGRPLVAAALKRLDVALQEARDTRTEVLTIIHGYGSSGKGGAIRTECRKRLDYLSARGKLNSYIIGEEYSRRDNRVKILLRRYPELGGDKNLNAGNPGISVIIL